MPSTIGSLIGGAVGAGNAAPGVSNYYPNVNEAANNWGTLQQNSTNNAQQLQTGAAPAATDTFNRAYNNPFAQQYQQGAQGAGQAMQGAGNAALQNSSALSSSANSFLPYMQQVMQQGLDPRNDQYNRAAQQNRDQSNVTNSQMGITGPYAAGNVNQSMQNFNTDWQNQQLQRSIQALGAGGTALNQAGAGAQTASNLGTAGAGNLYTGAGLPYTTSNTVTGNQWQDINNYINSIGGINNVDSQTMTQLLQYLNSASGYGIQQNQNEMQNSAAGAAGGAQMGSDIASTAMMAASMFSDERLKENIVPVGKENGFNIYSFNYKSNPKKYIGVIAQEVAKTRPDAVVTRKGYFAVNYDKIGVRFREV